jgi:hypothetical protein
MAGLLRSSLMAVFVFTAAKSAIAQQECLSSLKVSATKSVTFLAVGASPGDKLAETMMCPNAERLRTDIFISGQAIDLAAFDSAAQLRPKISKLRADLVAASTKLHNATDRAARDAALQSLKITLLGAALATSTAGCVASGSTCIPAAAAAVALYETISSTASSAGDLLQIAKQAQDDIGKITPVLKAAEDQLNDNIAQQSKLRYNAMYTEMCKSIKAQCL